MESKRVFFVAHLFLQMHFAVSGLVSGQVSSKKMYVMLLYFGNFCFEIFGDLFFTGTFLTCSPHLKWPRNRD